MRVFLITGASIGVVGTVVGFLLGTVVCLNIEEIRRFLSWLTNTELFSPELYFLSQASRRHERQGNLGCRGHGARAIVAGHALSVMARGAARSGRSAALRVIRRDGRHHHDKRGSHVDSRHREQPLVFLHGVCRQFRQGDCDARYSQRRRARSLGGPVGGAGGAVRRRQIDAAAHRGPARTCRLRRGLYRRGRHVEPHRYRSAPGSAAPRSVSSISPIICCRNSRRSKMSSCRR